MGQRWGAAMAEKVAAQRRLWRRSDGNGDGGAAMGVAVVAAAADVHRPSLFACGCHLLLLTDTLLSSPLTSGMYFVFSYLVYTFST